MSGTTKLVEFDGTSSESKFSDTDFKKMDLGLQFLAGFRLGKKLGFHFKYDLGLTNIQNTEGDPTIKTRSLSFNASWIFATND